MNRIIKTILVIFLFVSIYSFPLPAHAISISISNLPTSIDRDQETEVELFFNCAGCGDSYMRGVFYPSGTNYFGFTKNNNDNWIGTSADRSLYYAITKSDLVDATWSGKLKIKPDSSDSAYIGPGEYLFKMGRYTSAGDSSADWSNELVVRITGPTPTASPTSSPTPNPTPSPTPIKTPSPTPTRTPSPSSVKTSTPSSTSSPEEVFLEEQIGSPGPQVLGSVTNLTEDPKPKFPLTAIGLILSGMGLVGFSVINIIKSTKKKL